MKLDPPLQRGLLLRRYKRFLADIKAPSGEEITIHCPNTGSMKACLAEGEACWYSTSDNAKRKYPNTWEIATTPDGDLAGVNTGRANALVVEAINQGVITQLQGYDALRTEVKYGEERSRIDILLESESRSLCYVEVKSVTLCEHDIGPGRGYFPDSVSTRGTKHLRELMLMVEQGARAVLLFCVQHTGIEQVSPAAHIDPEYTKTFYDAVARGVEVFAYRAKIDAQEIVLVEEVPVQLTPAD